MASTCPTTAKSLIIELAGVMSCVSALASPRLYTVGQFSASLKSNDLACEFEKVVTCEWSTDGVINEYIQPCEAIVDGRRTEVPALEEREEFALDGVLYEAFNTSGGLGTLCETLEGRVRSLNYRSIRYPGHAALMKALLHDLRLKDRREVLKDILENALPATLQDVVIVFVTVTGWRGGRLQQDSYAHKI